VPGPLNISATFISGLIFCVNVLGLVPMAALRMAVLMVALLLAKPCHADLPVHCLRTQVAGDWEFTLGPLGDGRSACGHRSPDSMDRQPPMNFVASMGPTSTRRFTLQNPDTVTSEHDGPGTWTMIYDEGFEVAVGDLVYFAFSKFELIPDQDGKKRNVSHCDQTEVGWYHDTARSRWGCYSGRKVDADSRFDTPSADSASKAGAGASNTIVDDSIIARTPKHSMALTSWLTSDQTMSAPDQRTATEPKEPLQSFPDALRPDFIEELYKAPPQYKPWVPKSAGFDKPMPSEWQESVADALNFLQLGWTAGTYNMFRGKTPRQLNTMAGVRRHRPRPRKQAQISKQMRSLSFLSIASAAGRGQEVGFDWRDRDGKNWLQPVVTQGDCGSCYTISTVHMLTARNRIRQGNLSEPAFSVSFPLYCSEYNQGCDGGYGFLLSKWSEDVGLIPEECAPFSQGGGSCQVLPSCDLGDRKYRASGHHYVGGYYGGSDAELIKRELMANGPVVMSFEPKEDFMYYKGGVYRSGPNKIHQEWEQVDHAVLLIGYDKEDDGQPFWTMQNSWGDDWGEGGYFRMARGDDESGCESIVVAADVVAEDVNMVLDKFIATL